MADRSFDPQVFQDLVDTAYDGVIVLEPRTDASGEIDDLVIRHVNPAGAAIIGFSDEAMWRDRGLVEVIPENRSSGLFDWYLEAWRAGGRHLTRTIEFATAVTGVAGTYALRAHRLGDLLAVRFRDITDEVALGEAERRGRERLEATLESISDAFFVLDHDWRFGYVNDEACRVLGRPRDELLGRVVWEEFPAAVGSEFERNYRHVAEEHESVTFETYYPEPLDTWYSVRAYPSDEGVTVYFQDVGPQRRLQERVAHAQRLESVAALAGGIAHDFNNLLTVVAGHASLLADDLGEDHPNRVDVDAIRTAAERARELTRQMLSFSRRQILRPRVADLNHLVDLLVPLARRTLPDELELRVTLSSEPILVEVDRTELFQALLGVVSNAVDAMPDGGQVLIETAMAELDESFVQRVPDLEPGWFGVVSVADEGLGMAPEVLDRALEPFYSTKSEGGTGLGLASVHGLARQLGGHVSLYSEPGSGTVVRIYLPLSDADAPDPDGDDERQPSTEARGDESVLVVDDNDSVRAFTARVLVEHGYRVVEAADRTSALEVLRDGDSDLGTPDLLVTDVVMPGGTGHDLALAASELVPDLAVLYVSGYTENSVIRHGVPTEDVEFLAKPFTPAQLAGRVRRILDEVSKSRPVE